MYTRGIESVRRGGIEMEKKEMSRQTQVVGLSKIWGVLQIVCGFIFFILSFSVSAFSLNSMGFIVGMFIITSGIVVYLIGVAIILLHKQEENTQ